MSQYKYTRSQAQQDKRWYDSYYASDDAEYIMAESLARFTIENNLKPVKLEVERPKQQGTYKREKVKAGLEAISFTPNAPVDGASISPQDQFLKCDAHEVLYGGAAGGGKSAALTADAAQQAQKLNYSAILFRKTIGDLEGSDGLLKLTKKFYPNAKAEYHAKNMRWDFYIAKTRFTPKLSAGSIYLRHLRTQGHVLAHEGLSYAFIGFDELQQHSEEDYLFLISRNRCINSHVTLKIRATANPGGKGHKWIKKRWGAWLDKQYPKNSAVAYDAFDSLGLEFKGKAKPGEIRWFAKINELDTEVPEGWLDEEGQASAKSRAYIPALLKDNQYLSQDINYKSNLKNLDFLRRERLLHGNWDVMEEGNIFKRDWFKIVRLPPLGLRWFRGIDTASSESEKADFTAYADVAIDGRNNIYIRYVDAQKVEWVKQRAWLKEISINDPCETGIERADNGKALYQDFKQDPDMAHLRFYSVVADRDKIERANLWNYRAEQGQVFLVEGGWNDAFIDECCQFGGEAGHDDRVDAVGLGITLALRKARVNAALVRNSVRSRDDN
jgi:predicted phage terminase large subunit-like protein